MTQVPLKIGLIARADNGGLGMQTKDFYDHVKPHKTLVVDISHLTSYENHFDRFPGAQVAKGFDISTEDMSEFLQDLDVVFTVECPYNHELYNIARSRGIKTVCQYNFEWLHHHGEPSAPAPDLWLSPSSWNMERMPFSPLKYLHVPINRLLFPFKLHRKAKTFLHIAGHKAHEDRNGTALLMDAIPLVQNHNIKFIIRSQGELPRPTTDHRLTIIKKDVLNYQNLYQGDVLLLPRRYGGLSLQLNEAMSLGMVPLMIKAPPQVDLLDYRLLVEPDSVTTTKIKTDVQVYNCTPEALAAKIDELAEQDISKYSIQSDVYAAQRDWKIMLPQYMEMFEELCKS